MAVEIDKQMSKELVRGQSIYCLVYNIKGFRFVSQIRNQIRDFNHGSNIWCQFLKGHSEYYGNLKEK